MANDDFANGPERVPAATFPVHYVDPFLQGVGNPPADGVRQLQNGFTALQNYCCAFISGGNTIPTTNPFVLGVLAQVGGYSIASSTRLTVPAAGVYMVTFQVVASVNNAINPANLDVTLRKNGSTDINRIAGTRYSTSTTFELFTPTRCARAHAGRGRLPRDHQRLGRERDDELNLQRDVYRAPDRMTWREIPNAALQHAQRGHRVHPDYWYRYTITAWRAHVAALPTNALPPLLVCIDDEHRKCLAQGERGARAAHVNAAKARTVRLELERRTHPRAR